MDFVGKAVETASGSKRKMVSEELENMRGPDGHGAAAGWRIADNRSGGQRAWRERGLSYAGKWVMTE